MSPYGHMWWDAPEPDGEEILTDLPHDELIVSAGTVCWFVLDAHDDDTDD